MANLQYGFDLAAIGSLQAMPGFLKVFGYPDAVSEGGYAIDVRLYSPLSERHAQTDEQAIHIEHGSTTDNVSPNSGLLRLFTSSRLLLSLPRPPTCLVARLHRQRHRMRNPNRRALTGSSIPWTSPIRIRERIPGYILQYLHCRGITSPPAWRDGCSVRVLGEYR